MKPSDLLEAEDQLVGHLEPLPFQEGRPLATVAEESTELVDEGSEELISHQVLMAEEGEDDGDLPIDELDTVSEDEATANAGDEDDTGREARRTRNRARPARRRRVNERMRSMHRELDAEFATVSERGFRTPVANIVNISEEDIIDCFYNGITDPSIYTDFGRNRPKSVAGLRDMMHEWSEQEEKMRERFPQRQDGNLRRPHDNRNDKSQRDYSGPPRKCKPDDLITAVDRPSRGKKSTM
jgi:hypothetical protein